MFFSSVPDGLFFCFVYRVIDDMHIVICWPNIVYVSDSFTLWLFLLVHGKILLRPRLSCAELYFKGKFFLTLAWFWNACYNFRHQKNLRFLPFFHSFFQTKCNSRENILIGFVFVTQFRFLAKSFLYSDQYVKLESLPIFTKNMCFRNPTLKQELYS